MSDDKGNVVDLSERFAAERARRFHRARGPSLLERSGIELHPIHAEIQDMIDQILDRAVIYAKAGRPDEAERFRAGLKHALDAVRNPPTPEKYRKKAKGQDKA